MAESDPKQPKTVENPPPKRDADATPQDYKDLFLPPALAEAIEKAIRESMKDEPGKLPAWMRSKSAREAFQDAFETVGGLPRLAVFAHYNYEKFITLYARLIPLTVAGDPDAPVRVIAPWLSGQRFSGPAADNSNPPIDVVPQVPTPIQEPMLAELPEDKSNSH